jgi:hypothetical protein
LSPIERAADERRDLQRSGVPGRKLRHANGTIVGNVIALTAITLNPGFVVNGRVLARNAAVTLTTGTISNAGC